MPNTTTNIRGYTNSDNEEFYFIDANGRKMLAQEYDEESRTGYSTNEYVIQDNKLYKCLRPTGGIWGEESPSGAWKQQTVTEAINELVQSLISTETFSTTWTQGGYTTSGNAAANTKRIRSESLTKDKFTHATELYTNSGYCFLIYGWDAGGTFLGWRRNTDNTWSKSGNSATDTNTAYANFLKAYFTNLSATELKSIFSSGAASISIILQKMPQTVDGTRTLENISPDEGNNLNIKMLPERISTEGIYAALENTEMALDMLNNLRADVTLTYEYGGVNAANGNFSTVKTRLHTPYTDMSFFSVYDTIELDSNNYYFAIYGKDSSGQALGWLNFSTQTWSTGSISSSGWYQEQILEVKNLLNMIANADEASETQCASITIVIRNSDGNAQLATTDGQHLHYTTIGIAAGEDKSPYNHGTLKTYSGGLVDWYAANIDENNEEFSTNAKRYIYHYNAYHHFDGESEVNKPIYFTYNNNINPDSNIYVKPATGSDDNVSIYTCYYPDIIDAYESLRYAHPEYITRNALGNVRKIHADNSDTLNPQFEANALARSTFESTIDSTILDQEYLLDGESNDTPGYTIWEYVFKPRVRTNPLDSRVIPKIYLDAGIHGFERCAVFGLFQFMYDVTENWTTNKSLETLRNNVEFHIIPVSNPYGFNHNFYTNERGVNINRNFVHPGYDEETDAASWEKTDASASQYNGPAPFSEPETQILRDWLESAETSITFYANLHTDGNGTVPTYYTMNHCMTSNDRNDEYFNRIFSVFSTHITEQSFHWPLEVKPQYTIDGKTYDETIALTNDGTLNSFCGCFHLYATSEDTSGANKGTAQTYAHSVLNILAMTLEGFAGVAAEVDSQPIGGVIPTCSTTSVRLNAENIGNIVIQILREYSN